jgi:hypothetical protein
MRCSRAPLGGGVVVHLEAEEGPLAVRIV